STGQWDAWAEDLFEVGDRGWSGDTLAAEFADYLAQYPSEETGEVAIGIDSDARGPNRFVVIEAGDGWRVEQILADPEGHDEWYLTVTLDIAASGEAGDVVARFEGVRRR